MSVARGPKASGGTDFVTGFTILASEMNFDLNALVTGVNNIVIADANVAAGANIDPSKIGDFADSDPVFKTTAPPATRGHSDTVTATGFGILTTSRPTTLEEELQRDRYFWKASFAGIVDNTTGLPVQDEWYAPVEKGVLLAATGMMFPYFGSTAPSGWITWTDGSIGNSASGATNRASYDTRELFRMLWRMFSDTICPVSTGRGADPDADFNAGKTLRLPLGSGRLMGIAGTPSSSNTFDVINMASFNPGTDTANTVTINSNNKWLTANILNGYTLTVTSGARNGQSATVTAYAVGAGGVNGTLTIGAGLAGAMAAGDTFTLTTTIATRAAADRLGKGTLIPVGSNNTQGAGGPTPIEAHTGYGATAGATPIHEVTNYAPSIFMNWIIKL